MSDDMNYILRITGSDDVGHIATITGYLFEIGANLADTSFAVLGTGFEFSSLIEFNANIDANEIEEGLRAQGLPDNTRISLTPASYGFDRDAGSVITHVVEFSGGDRPGLVARMSEVLGKYSANIVRMSSRRSEGDEGYDYRTRFAVNIQPDTYKALETALYNTAGSLRLKCKVETV
ncbi:glycine cleavage system protein R [Kordiimonas sp. SCSIO 12610]|uniref:glycine cleavage system protein R n=1 Tax=Kordiimonas sp. SCSIO 12610 TaxID=2829597 RepID=UPI00210AE0E8|nr:ACT domain-containing protein [Kordiimonas sp. SCSIO 12610]UTW54209.1 ACT domain-containing protein [Kordiimonas sp. SCSIO 12610]